MNQNIDKDPNQIKKERQVLLNRIADKITFLSNEIEELAVSELDIDRFIAKSVKNLKEIDYLCAKAYELKPGFFKTRTIKKIHKVVIDQLKVIGKTKNGN